ncbi:MAG TPA: metalloregulator ArsR/SmtB family transcription factor [Cyclobacteriaceae bacterium]|jgi:DNA-binding transcriptional ArsR family regulator|nr:metalloregulator ArsR/SmtB family transcription factor [Cyclobacteriaceae bacterium]
MPVVRTRDAFRALSDPRRRLLIEYLSEVPLSISEIQSKIDISGPAIYEHIRILKECRMLNVIRRRKRKYYSIKVEKLHGVVTWIEKVEKNKTRMMKK